MSRKLWKNARRVARTAGEVIQARKFAALEVPAWRRWIRRLIPGPYEAWMDKRVEYLLGVKQKAIKKVSHSVVEDEHARGS